MTTIADLARRARFDVRCLAVRTGEDRPHAGLIVPRARLLAGIVALAIGVVPSAAAGQTPNPEPATAPLPHTHAHNDYQHEHPLFDALSHRFASVEADIWLANDGSLLVGHNKDTLQHDRTLQALYLDPLMDLVSRNGGHVFSGSDASLQLLIDVKNTGTATYSALDRELRTRYGSMLTSWSGGVERRGAVTIVISGDRDRTLMAAQPVRYAAFDGRLADLGDGTSPSFMPLISDSWSSIFKWKGTGEMPADERAMLQSIVAEAHTNGQQVRFYGTPDRSAGQYLDVWREELLAGVDWLNTDKLTALESFLMPQGPFS